MPTAVDCSTTQLPHIRCHRSCTRSSYWTGWIELHWSTRRHRYRIRWGGTATATSTAVTSITTTTQISNNSTTRLTTSPVFIGCIYSLPPSTDSNPLESTSVKSSSFANIASACIGVLGFLATVLRTYLSLSFARDSSTLCNTF